MTFLGKWRLPLLIQSYFQPHIRGVRVALVAVGALREESESGIAAAVRYTAASQENGTHIVPNNSKYATSRSKYVAVGNATAQRVRDRSERTLWQDLCGGRTDIGWVFAAGFKTRNRSNMVKHGNPPILHRFPLRLVADTV